MKKLIFVVLCSFGGCAVQTIEDIPITPGVEIVPRGMIFSVSQKVQIIPYGDVESVVYSINGEEPKCGASVVYTGELSVTNSIVLRARACNGNWQPSEIARATFLKSP